MRLWEEVDEIQDLIGKVGDASIACWDYSKEVYPRRTALTSEEIITKYDLFVVLEKTRQAAWDELKTIVEALVESGEYAVNCDLNLKTKDPSRLGVHQRSGAAYWFERVSENYTRDPYSAAATTELERFFDILIQHYCRVAEGWYERHNVSQVEGKGESADEGAAAELDDPAFFGVENARRQPPMID